MGRAEDRAPAGSTSSETSGAEATNAGGAPAKLPLSPLPRPPSIELSPPDAASLEALDAELALLTSKETADRETGAAEILEVEPDRLPAIHRRLVTIAESSDHEAMKSLLSGVRDKARDDVRQLLRAEDVHEKVSTPDYLEMLTSHPKPDSKTWRDLVSVVAMSRMLGRIGTVGAARELVGIYARFGEFMRVDTQLVLAKMGDHAVAALIEAERHPAPKIAAWATKQLDRLGKSSPSEAVSIKDPEALADILRAYGRARSPDATRLVISFANSERTEIREAARQAVALMGEVANWQLRDTYEDIVGKKPPREWSWDRTARELFAEFDRTRLAEVYVIFERGLAAEQAGKLDEMAADFDQVLAQSPVFERAPEMLAGYLAYARAHLDDEPPEKAVRALRRIDRLASDGDLQKKPAESLLLTLEAEGLFEKHVADPVVLRRAIELDPQNARAKGLLDRMNRRDTDVEERTHRYLAAGAIAFAALASLVLIFLKRRPGAAPLEPVFEGPTGGSVAGPGEPPKNDGPSEPPAT